MASTGFRRWLENVKKLNVLFATLLAASATDFAAFCVCVQKLYLMVWKRDGRRREAVDLMLGEMA